MGPIYNVKSENPTSKSLCLASAIYIHIRTTVEASALQLVP